MHSAPTKNGYCHPHNYLFHCMFPLFCQRSSSARLSFMQDKIFRNSEPSVKSMFLRGFRLFYTNYLCVSPNLNVSHINVGPVHSGSEICSLQLKFNVVRAVPEPFHITVFTFFHGAAVIGATLAFS